MNHQQSKGEPGPVSQKVGFGMIGCGAMGRRVAELLLAANRRLVLRGFCDPDDRTEEPTRLLAPDAVRYPDYRALLRAPEVDWVLIASWNAQHRMHAVAALQAGKHVFCQKPLATTFADCMAIRRAWEKNSRMFNIGFTLRYSPHYRKIRDLIANGAIGRLVSMEFNETLDFNHGGFIMGDWRRLQAHAGSFLLEKCCHDIDLANWMTGSLALRVASFGGTDVFVPGNAHFVARVGPNREGREAYQSWGGPIALNPFTSDKDVFDNQVVILEYASGVRATFHLNAATAMPERRMYLCGTEGTLRADVIKGTIEHRRIGFDTTVETPQTGASGGHGGGDEVLAQELCASILDGTPPAAGLMDGMTSALTCFAIDRAAATGRVVDVRPLWRKAGISPAPTMLPLEMQARSR